MAHLWFQYYEKENLETFQNTTTLDPNPNPDPPLAPTHLPIRALFRKNRQVLFLIIDHIKNRTRYTKLVSGFHNLSKIVIQ